MPKELTIFILVHDSDYGTNVTGYLTSKECDDAANEMRKAWAEDNDVTYKDMDDLAEKFGDQSQDWIKTEELTFPAKDVRKAFTYVTI